MSTRPLSGTRHRPRRASPADNAPVRPDRSASIRSKAAPTCDTTPAPSGDPQILRPRRRLRQVIRQAGVAPRKCLPGREPCRCRNHKSPLPERRFRPSTRRTIPQDSDHHRSTPASDGSTPASSIARSDPVCPVRTRVLAGITSLRAFRLSQSCASWAACGSRHPPPAAPTAAQRRTPGAPDDGESRHSVPLVASASVLCRRGHQRSIRLWHRSCRTVPHRPLVAPGPFQDAPDGSFPLCRLRDLGGGLSAAGAATTEAWHERYPPHEATV